MSKTKKKPGRGGRRKNAGRKIDPKLGRRVPLGVSVPETLLLAVEDYATAEGVTRSQATTDLLTASLGRPAR